MWTRSKRREHEKLTLSYHQIRENTHARKYVRRCSPMAQKPLSQLTAKKTRGVFIVRRIISLLNAFPFSRPSITCFIRIKH